MGIINGGPFGAMKNKTGNLVFRKVKRQNVVTIYVPNPRDPKTVQQLYFRSIIQRIGKEMSTGLADVAATLFREKLEEQRPSSKMISKTALFYNNADLPTVIFPQFGEGSLKKDIPIQTIYNPFFDCLSFPLLHNDSISQGKLPLLLMIGYNRFSGTWGVVPDCICLMDGFQGNCYEGGQIAEDTWEVVTYANYLYCGVEFWLEMDVEQGIIDNNNYNNDINANFLPGTLKTSEDWQNLPVIVASETNLKELRNFVPGFGYTSKMRKGTIFTPTMLNKVAGKLIKRNSGNIFYTWAGSSTGFNNLVKLEQSINNNNVYGYWKTDTKLKLDRFDAAAVIAALGTNNITVNVWFLVSSKLHTYTENGSSFGIAAVPSEILIEAGTIVKPVSVMVTYTNNDTAITYLDFTKHFFNPHQPTPLSQLEFYYNNLPQRHITAGGNPGIHLSVNKIIDSITTRADAFAVEVYLYNTVDPLEYVTDSLGNLIHEFTNEEMLIIGTGSESKKIIRLVIGDGTHQIDETVEVLISGNCYSFIGEYTVDCNV
jgi:hypothetical protein